MVQATLFEPGSSWTPPEDLPSIKGSRLISFDTETRDENLRERGPGAARKDGYLVGISIATDTGVCCYLPVRHKMGGNLSEDKVFSYVREVLGTDVPKIGANLLYDLEQLRAEGIEVKGPLHDIQIAEPLINENLRGYSLDAIAFRRLNRKKDETLLKEAADAFGLDPKKELWKLHSRYVGPYAEEDARLPLQIYPLQMKDIESQNLHQIYDLESRLIRLLLDMRFQGVRVDVDRAKELYEKLTDEYANKRIILGFNPRSAQDLANYCNHMGIGYPVTDKGNPSFTSSWLEENSDDFILKTTLEARQAIKMRDDFVKKIVDYSVDGRLHCQFHQLMEDDYGTRSGRFSSSNINLQQIPSRNPKWKARIRSLFLPDEGKVWARADYSQQEPRLTVHYASLLGYASALSAAKKYNEDPATDFHQMTADMARIGRTPAKTINLGLSYGMGEEKLARSLGINLFDAKKIFEQYHASVEFVRKLQNVCMARVNNVGYITTIMGRRRRFTPEDGSHKYLNGLIQGSAADMIKKAMLDIYEKYGYVPHVTVHDELGYSVDSVQMIDNIKNTMRDTIKLQVPLKVDVDLGPNWGTIFTDEEEQEWKKKATLDHI